MRKLDHNNVEPELVPHISSFRDNVALFIAHSPSTFHCRLFYSAILCNSPLPVAFTSPCAIALYSEWSGPWLKQLTASDGSINKCVPVMFILEL